jgi:hypothetical protein
MTTSVTRQSQARIGLRCTTTTQQGRHLQVLAGSCRFHHQLVRQSVLGTEESAAWSQTRGRDNARRTPHAVPLLTHLSPLNSNAPSAVIRPRQSLCSPPVTQHGLTPLLASFAVPPPSSCRRGSSTERMATSLGVVIMILNSSSTRGLNKSRVLRCRSHKTLTCYLIA